MGKERDNYFKKLPKNLMYQPVDTVRIGKKIVGAGQPVFIIAEVGANHRGDIKNALRFIDMAAKSGADAVKFQHLIHDKIAADTPIDISWHGKSGWKTLSEFYKSSELPYEWTGRLVEYAKKKNIIFLSTPFDKKAVDVLAKAKVPAFKVASYEMTDDILLRYIARQDKPIILSTGMAYLEEVAHATRIIQEEGNNDIILLHCVSMYPPRNFSDLNLRAIETLRSAFHLPVGYSDHSQPPFVAAPLAAVALGVCVIEKHFTDARSGGSHDDPNSMEPADFKRLVGEIRMAEAALSGSGIKQPVSYQDHSEDEIFDRWARRSLYASKDISKGTELTENMIISLRPYGGIDTRHMNLILGKKVKKGIKARSPIVWEDIFGD